MKTRLRQQLEKQPDTADEAGAPGRNSFYSEEMLEKRSAVREDAKVLEALHMWWITALQTKDVVALENGTLAKDAYVAIQCRVYKALMDNYDEEDALACAEEDWERDVQGLDAMHRDSFTDGLFELADLYTETSEAADYATFLWKLLQSVATRSEDGSLYFWKEVANITLASDLADRVSASALDHTSAIWTKSLQGGGGMRGPGFGRVSSSDADGNFAPMHSRASRIQTMERASQRASAAAVDDGEAGGSGAADRGADRGAANGSARAKRSSFAESPIGKALGLNRGSPKKGMGAGKGAVSPPRRVAGRQAAASGAGSPTLWKTDIGASSPARGWGSQPGWGNRGPGQALAYSSPPRVAPNIPAPTKHDWTAIHAEADERRQAVEAIKRRMAGLT